MGENKFFETVNLKSEEKEAGIEEGEEERITSPEGIESEVSEVRDQLAALKEAAADLRERTAKARGRKKAALEQELQLVEEQIAESEDFLGEVDSGEFEIEEIGIKPAKKEESKKEAEE